MVWGFENQSIMARGGFTLLLISIARGSILVLKHTKSIFTQSELQNDVTFMYHYPFFRDAG